MVKKKPGPPLGRRTVRERIRPLSHHTATIKLPNRVSRRVQNNAATLFKYKYVEYVYKNLNYKSLLFDSYKWSSLPCLLVSNTPLSMSFLFLTSCTKSSHGYPQFWYPLGFILHMTLHRHPLASRGCSFRVAVPTVVGVDALFWLLTRSWHALHNHLMSFWLTPTY